MGTIFRILTAVLCLEAVKCDILVAPVDTEVMVNDSVYFNCSTSLPSQGVMWKMDPADSNTARYIYTKDGMRENFPKRFYVDEDKTKGVYNLVITRVLIYDGGSFECEEYSSGVKGKTSDKRKAQLAVLKKHSPVCRSIIPPEGVVGPNDCGFKPTTAIGLSCFVEYQAHAVLKPTLEWSSELRNGSKNVRQDVSCKTTALNTTCNVTVDTEQLRNGSSFVCSSKRSPAHRCSVGDIKISYAFKNKEVIEKTVNEKVICVANSSQKCTYSWKSFGWDKDITVASSSEFVPDRDGWYRCEAECQFGSRTCPLVAMIIHVSSPPKECTGSGSIVAVMALAGGSAILFLILVFVICQNWRKIKYSELQG